MRVRPVVALIAATLFPLVASAGAELRSVIVWERPERYFGGMSAIDLAPDGSEFVATGDNAQAMIGTLLREDGEIVGIKSPWVGGWQTPEGVRVGAGMDDSEGIALREDGRIFVSFERAHRVWSYTDRDSIAEPLPDHPAFAQLRENRGLEALAIDAEGRLVAIPERPPSGMDDVPVFRLEDGAWTIVGTLPADDRFRPTGADFDDQGRLFILQRALGLFGFATRVQTVVLGEDGVSEPVTILETEAGERDNLEGIAVWRDPEGYLRLVMISDDNYKWFQQTEIVEYRLTE